MDSSKMEPALIAQIGLNNAMFSLKFNEIIEIILYFKF